MHIFGPTRRSGRRRAPRGAGMRMRTRESQAVAALRAAHGRAEAKCAIARMCNCFLLVLLHVHVRFSFEAPGDRWLLEHGTRRPRWAAWPNGGWYVRSRAGQRCAPHAGAKKEIEKGSSSTGRICGERSASPPASVRGLREAQARRRGSGRRGALRGATAAAAWEGNLA